MHTRRFERISCNAPIVLTYHDFTYHGHLVNLSLNGALVCADECIMISPGEECTLAIHPDDTSAPLVFQAFVVHAFFSMVGVRFVFDGEEHPRLQQLLQGLSKNPQALFLEWQRLLELQEQPEHPAHEANKTSPPDDKVLYSA